MIEAFCREDSQRWHKSIVSILKEILPILEQFPNELYSDKVYSLLEATGHLRAACELLKQFGTDHKFESQIPAPPISKAESQLGMIKELIRAIEEDRDLN